MIEVRRALARYETVQPGITTRHCFSANAHYDPDNVGFGPLVAVDEHVVAPGAGFSRHAHRGVEILSWVLAGTLCHQDCAGRQERVGPGAAIHQWAGSGIEHTERNASDAAPLHFFQLMLLADAESPPQVVRGFLPLGAGAGEFTLLDCDGLVELAAAEHLHLFLASGTASVGGWHLDAGDSARIRDESLVVDLRGQLLVWCSNSGGVA